MSPESRIYVAGHRGLVGSAVVRRLTIERYGNIVTRARAELDLTDQTAVNRFFAVEHPEYVILAAARVGGILANRDNPAEFIRDNLLIQTNVIDAAYRNGVKRLLFLGSSCIYPKHAPQPLREEYLLTGPLEPTNDAYAVAKIAGVKMCQSYARQYGLDAICVMPTNLYGSGDNFDLNNSHVIPALIRKFEEARLSSEETVTIWGSGEPRREFLYVDDLADACVYILGIPTERLQSVAPDTMLNIGVGEDLTIRELALIVGKAVGSNVRLQFDLSKPDGTPRKLLDVSRMRALGWQAKTQIADGLSATIDWFRTNR